MIGSRTVVRVRRVLRRTVRRLRRREMLRILVSLHSDVKAVGGTERHTRDLIRYVPDARFYVAVPRGDGVDVAGWDDEGSTGEAWTVTTDEEYGRLLRRLRVDVVHVEHLMGHSLSPIDAAEATNVPVVFVWEDYYLACRSYKLLDWQGRFCWWCVDLARCNTCLEGQFGAGMESQESWRHRMREIVDRVDVHVFPSESVRTGADRIFPMTGKRTVVIPHGVPRPRSRPLRKRRANRPLRVAYLGIWCEEKGSQVFRSVAEELGTDEFEWHVFGAVSPGSEDTVPSNAILHGFYRTGGIDERLRAAEIDVVVLASIWPETFCYTLSESWTAGVPVAGSSLGAIGERLRRSGAGWTFDPEDPTELGTILRRLRDDPGELERVTATTRSLRAYDVREMALEYGRLYRRLAAGPTIRS